ncbi:MAG: hypothetical protein HQ557_06585 [Bacteroidetes bacterium]|nr:hypothetical protein [Bacteroidota bacterium]
MTIDIPVSAVFAAVDKLNSISTFFDYFLTYYNHYLLTIEHQYPVLTKLSGGKHLLTGIIIQHQRSA